MNDPAPAPASAAAPQPGPPATENRTPTSLCANCGAPMYGEFCYACGQPKKGLIRHFSSILGDFFDTVLNIDSRLLRSLFPLYFRPGYLSNEYFAGRRVRYVTPFRLFFFLCVFAFVALRVLTESSQGGIHIGNPNDEITEARTVQEVDERTQRALADIRETFRTAQSKPPSGAAGDKSSKPEPAAAQSSASGSTDQPVAKDKAEGPGAAAATIEHAADLRIQAALDKAEKRVLRQAERRKKYLADLDAAKREGRVPPPDPDDDIGHFQFGNGDWDAEKNPLKFSWLPDAGNRLVNERIGRAVTAVRDAKKNPRPVIEAFFGAVPPTLFLLMPIFALVLKVFYVFKRRLYMEHLIVALHSHAFICLSLLSIALLMLLRNQLDPTGWVASVTGKVAGIMGWWIPLYLLLMQKRVYKQGWIMTVIKYGTIGITYTVLLCFGLVLAIVGGLLSL